MIDLSHLETPQIWSLENVELDNLTEQIFLQMEWTLESMQMDL